MNKKDKIAKMQVEAQKRRIITYKKRIILIMVLFFLLPTLANIFGLTKIIPGILINENRNRKSMPEGGIYEAFIDDGKYMRSWEDFYNDYFGTRDLFIRCKNQINYSLFHNSPELYFDSKGNMYYYSVVAAEQIYNENMTADTELALISSYKKIADFCADKNIEYAFMLAPQKNTTYAVNNLPVRRSEPNKYERFTGLLKKEFPDNFVDILEQLREANKIAPVFYKTDFHWNDYGAAVGFGEVINHFAKKEGLEPPFRNEFEFIDIPKIKGGQLSNLGVVLSPTEKAITVSRLDPSITSITVPVTEYENKPSAIHFVNQGEATLKGIAVIIGDSFTPPAISSDHGTNSGIREYFSEVYFINWNHSEGILNNLPENTKYLITERIEAGISYHGSWLEELFNNI